MSESPVKWTPPPESLALARGDIQCWLIALDRPADDALLSADERARADRFHFDHDRRRFVAGRVARRMVLARYLGRSAAALRFEETEYGRPFIDGAPVNFNMSRSQDWALLAVSTGDVIGVDLEAIKNEEDLSSVAKDNFSSVELAALSVLQGEAWTKGFYNCWTRKEAVVKAIGAGLSIPLNQFDVSLASGEGAKIIRAGSQASPAQGWTLSAFKPLDGYCAAVASDIAAPKLHFYQFKD